MVSKIRTVQHIQYTEINFIPENILTFIKCFFIIVKHLYLYQKI